MSLVIIFFTSLNMISFLFISIPGTILQTIYIECVFNVLKHSYGSIMEEWKEGDMKSKY